MPSHASTPVPPNRAEPASAASPSEAEPNSDGTNQPTEDGDFCRGEIRTLDDSEGLGPLFPGRNRHKSGHSSLACSLLCASAMTATASPQTSSRGIAPKPEVGTDLVTRTPWLVEEQPRFRDGLRILTPTHRESGPGLHLRSPLSLEPTIQRDLPLPLKQVAKANRPSRAPRGSVAIPLAMLTAISLLGYVAAVQSVSAFQAAWRNTDTHAFEQTARVQSAYRAEDGQIPAPFASLPSR